MGAGNPYHIAATLSLADVETMVESLPASKRAQHLKMLFTNHLSRFWSYISRCLELIKVILNSLL